MAANGCGSPAKTVRPSCSIGLVFPCISCAAGEWDFCRNGQYTERGIKQRDGYCSERYRIEPDFVVKLDPALGRCGVLLEPTSVVAKAWEEVDRVGGRAHWDPRTVLVTGAGPIGLLLAAVLKAQGLTVIISEVAEARKDKARTTGVADHVIDPSQEDLAARVRQLTGGNGADVGFECTSVNAALDQLFDAIKPAGVIVNVSIWGKPASIDMQKLVLKEIDLRGTIAYVRDHSATIKLVQEGKVDLKPFITARIGLDDLVEDGFGTLIHHKDTAVKILVHP